MELKKHLSEIIFAELNLNTRLDIFGIKGSDNSYTDLNLR
jgi:hypothetical protein